MVQSGVIETLLRNSVDYQTECRRLCTDHPLCVVWVASTISSGAPISCWLIRDFGTIIWERKFERNVGISCNMATKGLAGKFVIQLKRTHVQY